MWIPFLNGKCHPTSSAPVSWLDPTSTSVIWHHQKKWGHLEGCFPGADSPAMKINISVFSWHFVLIVTQMHFSICLATGDNCARMKGSQKDLLLHFGTSWWDYCSLLISEHRGSDGSAILWSIMQHIRCSQSTFIEELSWNNIFFLHLFCL